MTTERGADSHQPLEALPAGLIDTLASGHGLAADPARVAPPVEHVQTHISHVFLTGDRVYKLRKAVVLPFLSFATRAERNADCERELRLNRRLAPSVYLGLAAVLRDGATWRLGPVVEDLAPDESSCEHCVVMRRLPSERNAQRMLEKGQLEVEHVDAVAERLASFHALHGLGAPAPFSRDVWEQRVVGPVRDTFALAAGAGCARVATERLRKLERRADAWMEQRRERFEARRRAGRAVDGHGDLHLDHVWFERDDDPPLLIDCIEFRRDFRCIDAASEVAFLAMDLRYRGRWDLGERFLRRYARAGDDFDLYAVVDYFVLYRAMVRCGVAAVAAGDAAITPAQREAAARSAADHLRLAEEALPTRRGGVVAVSGIVGTGKTTVAEGLADALGGVVISSDRVRKHLAGLAPTSREGAEPPGPGLYTRAWDDRVYAGLLERAEAVVGSGRVALLDATFARGARREALRRWAADRGVPARLVETCCEPAVARERLARRSAQGADASDAGPELHARSAAGYESPDEWPVAERAQVHTDAPDWGDGLAGLARRLF